MAKRDFYDELVEQLADYIENTAKALADAQIEGRAKPFAAVTSRQDELDYYRVRFGAPTGGLLPAEMALTTPDGQRIGANGIARVYKELAKALPPPAPIPEG